MPQPASGSPPIRTMQCMEVWGGYHAADQGVTMPGLDLWVYSEPAAGQDLGGDVHYVSSCGTGRITRLVLADVSGHGAQVAALARSLRILMRRFVNYLDQTRFVEALNQGLLEWDGTGRFATSVAMTFFAPTGRLDVCNAGHPRPLWRRAGAGRWEVLDALAEPARSEPSNLPLGVLGPTHYEEFGVNLSRGDLVLAFTDAAVEAASPSGEMLGEAGLRRLVESLDASRPETLLAGLREGLAAWRGGREPADDLTLLLLRCTGGRPRAPLAARLWSGVRLLGMMLRRLLPWGDPPPVPWPERSVVALLGVFSHRVSQRWRGARRRSE